MICSKKSCKNPVDGGFKTCEACRARARVSSARHRERHPEKAKASSRASYQRVRNDPNLLEAWRASRREYNSREEVRERNRQARLKHRLGIEAVAVEAMHREQDGRCACCGDEIRLWGRDGLQVDHCHSTGNIRGLLCGSCNGGLGLFRDDPERLRKAIAYLAEHGVEVS